ncbi:MAG: RNA polymerase sigma factor [Solirubrobacteraceae bacterium]
MSSAAAPPDDPAELERRRARALDHRLAVRVGRGEDGAFFELHERHRPALVAFARQIVGDHDDAEDVVQQSMIRAYQALRRGQRPEHVRAWLYTITRNRACTLVAGRARRPVPDDDRGAAAWSPGADDAALQRADLRAVLDDLARLPEQQRTALVLTEMSGMPQRHIAGVLGVEEQRVGWLVFQARRTLGADRDARLTPCEEIREQLAVARGPALRRGPLRRHLRQCSACRGYRREVERQQRSLALLFPALATAPGVREAALAGAAGAGALAAPQPLVAPASGGLAALAGKAAALVATAGKVAGGGGTPKAAVAVLAAGAMGAGAVNGGVPAADAPRDPSAAAPPASATAMTRAVGPGAATAATPVSTALTSSAASSTGTAAQRAPGRAAPAAGARDTRQGRPRAKRGAGREATAAVARARARRRDAAASRRAAAEVRRRPRPRPAEPVTAPAAVPEPSPAPEPTAPAPAEDRLVPERASRRAPSG